MTIISTPQANNELTDSTAATVADNWIKGPALNTIAPGTMRLLEDGQDGIVLVNFNGEFTAFRNACLHQGSPIHAGDLTSSGLLLCPWHNWGYDGRDGACLTAPGARLEQFSVRIQDGHLWVSKASPQPVQTSGR